MLGRETPLSFHTFLESPVHTEDLVTNIAPGTLQLSQTSRQEDQQVYKSQKKSCTPWLRYIKPIHGPITGILTGGFFIILGIILVLLRWIANSYQQLPMADLYGPILLVVAGGVCVITGFSIGLMGDRVHQDYVDSPVMIRQEPARAIQRRVETVTLRTRMDEQEVARREIREARYVTRSDSDGSRRGSGVIIQVTQPSPPHLPTTKADQTGDRRQSLQSESFESMDVSDELSRSDPGRLCPDGSNGSPVMVKQIPSSRRMSLHGDTDIQEDLSLVLGEVQDIGGDCDSVRESQAGDTRRGSDGRRGSLTNWSKGAVVNRSFEMD